MKRPTPPSRTWSRRELLQWASMAAAGGLALSAPRPGAAIGPLSQFDVARLDLPGLGRSRMSGLYVLAQELKLQSSIDVSLEVVETRLSDDKLFEYPFLVLIGDRRLGKLAQKDADLLKRWIEAGGTLFVDQVGAASGSEGFDQSFRELIDRIFPRNPLVRIPADHVLYRAFYRIDYPAGRIIEKPYLEAVPLEGRLAVIYSQNDVIGAWCRDSFGSWEYDVVPGGEGQRQVALRFGINLVLYTLCQDYKDDQVHLDYLLRKRKWKITPAETP
jgi:hypothetical protein